VWIAVSRLTELEKLSQTLARGQLSWVVVAAALQLAYFLFFAGMYQLSFATVGVKSRLWELLPVVFAATFLRLATSAAGAAVFVDEAGQRGESPARTAAGLVVAQIVDFVSFGAVLIAGMVYLFLRHDLKSYEVVAALLLLAGTVALGGVLALGFWRPVLLRRLLSWLQNTVNRAAGWIKKAPPLTDDWTARSAHEFAAAAGAVASRPLPAILATAAALVGLLLDLACLGALFRAYHQPVAFGVLVAGFAMGVLFWIVSFTPQGVGVVEGIMALVYTSLGVPAATATVISLAFRGLALWLPVAVGFVMLRRVKSFQAKRRWQWESWSVRTVALLTGLMGVVNVCSSLTPALAHRLALLDRFSPLEVRHRSHLTATLAGFALLLLSRSLCRRKRVAWSVTVAVLVVSVASHLLKGLDYEEALLAAALLAWLLALRPYFWARSDPPSVRNGIVVLGAALLFTLAYGTGGFYLLDRHFSVSFNLMAALRQTVLMFAELYNPGLEPVTGFGRYFADSIYAVGAATLAYALVSLLRPVLLRGPATREERARAEAIVRVYGRSSLARFTLFADKAYFFTPGGSVLAYAVRSGNAVALGDVIGPSEDAPAAIEAFKGHCARNDWKPAFYQTLSEYLEHYQAAGFLTLRVGHEAIVELKEFSLEGKQAKALRAAVNRLTKRGYSAQVHQPPLADALLEELRSVSDEWLNMMHGSEKRFSLGWFDEDYLRNGPAMAVHSPEGAVTAFANLVSEYQRNELTCDLMRRRNDPEPGTMDFLFVSLMQWAREQGYDSFNLGLSPLAGVGEDPGDPTAERAMHFIYEHLNQFYSFKGLHQFKEKFHPTWLPRYLVYADAASLPGAAFAIVSADSGGNPVTDHLRDLFQKRGRN